jgi:hypothetical protein
MDILIREYPKRRSKELVLFTGHPYGGVMRKAHKLGLKKNSRKYIVWRPAMTELLRKYYPDTPNALLAEWLEISVSSLQLKAAELGLEKIGRLKIPKRKLPDGTIRKLSSEQGEFIRRNINTMSQRRIARELGFAKCTISAYCKRHNITKKAV